MATNGRGPAVEERPLKEDLRRSRYEAQAVGSEIGEIASDVRFLIQKEAQLARAEVQETLNAGTRSLIFGGIAAFLAMPLTIFAFATLMFGLDTLMPLWAAAAITTGVLFVLVAIFGAVAYAMMKKMNVKPERTVKSLQEDIEWAKMRIQSTVR